MSGCGECGRSFVSGYNTGREVCERRFSVILGLWAFFNWVRFCEAERRSFYEGVAEGFFRSPGRFRR